MRWRIQAQCCREGERFSWCGGGYQKVLLHSISNVIAKFLRVNLNTINLVLLLVLLLKHFNIDILLFWGGCYCCCSKQTHLTSTCAPTNTDPLVTVLPANTFSKHDLGRWKKKEKEKKADVVIVVFFFFFLN
jgi:hypothetical protein